MAEKIILQDGKKVSVVEPKSFKKSDLIKIPQVFYVKSIFAPVFKNTCQISYEEKKTIKIHNFGRLNIFHPVLNQTHANIIDAILYNMLNREINDFSDSFNVTITSNEVFNTLHIKHNYSWLTKEIKEIQSIIFQIYEYRELLPNVQAPIIGSIVDSDKIVQNRYIGFQKKYAPYRIVTFSTLFNYLMRNSHTVSFPRAFIPKILELNHSINQAIARYCLASDNVNENLENLLVKLGVATGKIDSDKHLIQKELRHEYFSYIREEQGKLLEYFGIQIINQNTSGVFIQANKNDAVNIYAPKSPFITI